MSENSMRKATGKGWFGKDSGYTPSAPPNYRPPAPVRVPAAPAKGK